MSDECSETKTVKNTKLDKILDKLEELEKKINDLGNVKKTNYNNNKDDSYRNKRNVYLNKLNSNEIKQPKQETLDYYKVIYDSDIKLYV